MSLIQFVYIQTKLEYQPQYRMELLTHSEILRVNAYSGEIMEQQLLTANDVLPQISLRSILVMLCAIYMEFFKI